MDINAEVTTQLSLIHALLGDLDKPTPPCAIKHEKKEEEAQDAMPDSTTNTEKSTANQFHCGDDVFVLNKDGRYYLGTIVELSTSNDNDSCEVGTGVARCLVKFGDGTHSWAPVSALKLLSAPPADDGRIMCVVCKRREGPAASPHANAVIACDMCGRGYHAKCHSPPVEAWITGASWHCKRCVEQRYRVAAAENRALKRTDFCRLKPGPRRQDITPPCDTASTTSSTASETGKEVDSHCYCGQKTDWLAQMLLCCRCSKWYHQRCVKSLQYPLYAGDKLYIFACAACNGGAEYLRRLELCWLELAHLALYNLTAYNAPNYFDLDTVIMPYIMDNWHALQLPEKMWRVPSSTRREKILVALTSSRKRFKCGREMKKRATIWGLRLRRPPPPHAQLQHLEQVKKGVPLSDRLVRELAPRLRFLPRAPSPSPSPHGGAVRDDGFQPSSSNTDKSSYQMPSQNMIVPIDGEWLNLMTGKRFHENLAANSYSENESTSSCDKPERPAPAETPGAAGPARAARPPGPPRPPRPPRPADPPPADGLSTLASAAKDSEPTESLDFRTHSSRIATMNMEVSKLSTKNIIEHSKIMSLQHMDSNPYCSPELESSGDETSSRGTLDAIIPPLKDFQGKNNPFLMKNTAHNGKPKNGRHLLVGRLSLPGQLPAAGPFVRPLKRKLSEKDIIVGPNGEVKRRKYRRPKKYSLLQQLNKSCPLPDETPKTAAPTCEHGPAPAPLPHPLPLPLPLPARLHGRRLRQRQEKNYYENARRSNNTAALANNSVKSLQLSPHKTDDSGAHARQLSQLKSTVQSYFRAEQTYSVLARRRAPGDNPAYLIQWDTNTAT